MILVMTMFTAYLTKLLVMHHLFCVGMAHTQSCIKKGRFIPQPLLDARLDVRAAVAVTASSELNCIHRCYQVKGCDGINTIVDVNLSTVCEILVSEASTGSKRLVRKKGWKYYNLKQKSVCNENGKALCPESKIFVDDSSKQQGYLCLEVSNIAYLKKTKQSSNHDSSSSDSKAVDGNREGDFEKNTCTHTNESETSHWWRVDFGRVAKVQSVRISNRVDCCSERLGKFDILVGSSEVNDGRGNSVCQSSLDMTNIVKKKFSCQQVGRYMYIHSLLTQVLTLCEVEVFGALLPVDIC